VVLNSCNSTGTARVLVRGAISAVAAMQLTVSDPAAIAFVGGFYTAIAHGRSIDDSHAAAGCRSLAHPEPWNGSRRRSMFAATASSYSSSHLGSQRGASRNPGSYLRRNLASSYSPASRNTLIACKRPAQRNWSWAANAVLQRQALWNLYT
jgi:hypothetical protein